MCKLTVKLRVLIDKYEGRLHWYFLRRKMIKQTVAAYGKDVGNYPFFGKVAPEFFNQTKPETLEWMERVGVMVDGVVFSRSEEDKEKQPTQIRIDPENDRAC